MSHMPFDDMAQVEVKAVELNLILQNGNERAHSGGPGWDDSIQESLPCPPLDEFHCFPELPAELRCQIWKSALPGPRLLMLLEDLKNEVTRHPVSIDRGRCVETKAGKRRSDGWYVLNRFREHRSSYRGDSYFRPSILFQVCSESRNVALQTYDICLSISLDPDAKVSFSDLDEPCGVDVSHEKALFHGFRFQPASDTVWLKQNEEGATYGIISVAEPDELKTDSIQSLAISCYDFGSFGEFNAENELLGPVRRHFTNLKELIIVAEHDYGILGETLEYPYAEYRKTTLEKMRNLQQSSPDAYYPVVKVMTEYMLIRSF